MKITSSTLIDLKHEIMLASLLILLFGELFVPATFHRILQPILLLQAIMAGTILFSEGKKWRFLFFALFALSFTLSLYQFFYTSQTASSILRSIYIFIFLAISVETYRQIYNAKKVGPGLIAAVFSGFILLCLISSMFFGLIESQTPGSFSNLGDGPQKMQDLSYFSFITALTIGYGDIVPLTFMAKKATLLIALCGNFYTVFVTGVIIGKYLTKDT